MSENPAGRQAAILRAIVREYIRSGEPVGSKSLAGRAKMSVSPATIRNEMARLEELGYLTQPHTSAGRIPTDRGYRFLVDEIHAPASLGEGQRRALEEELTESEPGSVEEMLHRATEVVARFTHHAAAILAQRARGDRLRRLELFPMGARLANLVLISENGRVEQRMLPLGEHTTDADVDALGARLAPELSGTTLEDAVERLANEGERAPAETRSLLDGIASAVGALRDTRSQVVVGGVANLAGESGFERETLHRMYEALERQTAMLELLASTVETPVTVRIGAELGTEEFRSCSVVVANFGGSDAQGSIGVIGPTRMDYERVIATANTVARMLGSTLGATDEP
jgi:heat-inducible transcriptional repressor